MHQNKGLIFDMDGTMVDNMMVHHRAWQQKLAELGLDWTLDEVKENCVGTNDEILQKIFGEKYTFEERDNISFDKEVIYRKTFFKDLKLLEGLHELLENAYQHGIPMGLGTAARPENVNFVLDNLHIRHYFKAIITEKDVDKGKPDPSVFLKVADMLNIEYSQCLVFEDSPTGAKTALNAGMKAIILTTTHQAHEFNAIPSVIKCVSDYQKINILEELNHLSS